MSEFGNQERFILMAIRALKEMGDTHTISDVVEAINRGDMQSLTVGNSWAVTQVLDFPRKRVLQLFLVVGEGKDLEALEHKVEDLAVEVKADFIQAYARHGWHRRAEKMGWKFHRSIYTKEMH